MLHLELESAVHYKNGSFEWTKKWHFTGNKVDSLTYVNGSAKPITIILYSSISELKGIGTEAVLNVHVAHDSIYIDEASYENGEKGTVSQLIQFGNTNYRKKKSKNSTLFDFEIQTLRNDSIIIVDSIENDYPEKTYITRSNGKCNLYYGESEIIPNSIIEYIPGPNAGDFMIIQTEDDTVEKRYFKENTNSLHTLQNHIKLINYYKFNKYDILGRQRN